MAHVQRFAVFGLAAMAMLSVGVEAQAGDPATLIQEKLVTQIKMTKATADRSDIVTAGDVVVLHKDGLMMCSSASSYAFSNTYSDGVLAANYNNRTKDAAKSLFKSHLPFGGGGSVADAANNGCPSRKFVAGEKFWLTGVVSQKDGMLFSTFSDPFPDSSGNQVRYYGEIKFLFPKKGPVPPVDDFVKTVSEVMTVQPPDDNSQGNQSDQGGQPAQAAVPSAAPPPAPMPDIAPPPPPADTPTPTIALGQTRDQVTAAFGQPVRVAKLGAKETFYYKDKKVIFTNGKVSDVE